MIMYRTLHIANDCDFFLYLNSVFYTLSLCDVSISIIEFLVSKTIRNVYVSWVQQKQHAFSRANSRSKTLFLRIGTRIFFTWEIVG